MGIKNLFKSSKETWLVVGLGNPGPKYEETRHNVGFKAIDIMTRDVSTPFKLKLKANYTHRDIDGKRIYYVKPLTFMNNCGEAVKGLASYFKIPLNRIIVVFDDVSLDVGRMRIRARGSHGGHNGMRDINELCGTEEIMRIKIGVGAKLHPDMDLAKWVLSEFKDEEKKTLEQVYENTRKAVNLMIDGQIALAMNRYNRS